MKGDKFVQTLERVHNNSLLDYKLFYFMEHHELLECLSEHHLWALHYVYLPRMKLADKP